MRSILLILISLTILASSRADTVAETSLGDSSVSETVADNQAAPAQPPNIHPAFLVAGILFSTSLVLFLLAAHARSRIKRKTLIVGTIVLMVLTWAGFLLAISIAASN